MILNEDFFDDEDLKPVEVENPDYDEETTQPVYDYTVEILFLPEYFKDWINNYKLINRLKYILNTNRHIKQFSEPTLCTDYTQSILNGYLQSKGRERKQAEIVKEHYKEYTVIDRDNSKDSVGDQLIHPLICVHYIKFTFSHSFTNLNQVMQFYTALYNSSLHYILPDRAPQIGIQNNNTKRYKQHTSISPDDLFKNSGTELEAQRFFDFMLPNYTWQVF